jgi:DNA repair photolyase
MLKNELPRKRKKPALVYFSTACDPFMPDPKILQCVFKTMALFLKSSISILVSTKGYIPNEFLELFAQHTDKVRVQAGITTFDDEVRQIMEPNAASVAQRFDSMQRLVELGISVEARMDPLIPELSDTDSSFVLLCTQLQRIGIKKAVVSYLYLREHNRWPLNIKLDNWSFRDMTKRLYTHKIKDYCSGGSVRINTTDYRKAKYARLKQIAADHQISLGFCACKNPDLTDEYCFAQPAAGPMQTTLF